MRNTPGFSTTRTPPSEKTPEDLFQREQWVRDITELMTIVILAAAVIITIGTLARLFTFQETFPVYVLLVFIIPAWLGARRGGWRWARYFPILLCFAMGIYSSINNGFVSIFVLFYFLAVLLTGMLHGSRMAIFMIAASAAAYIGFGFWHDGYNSNTLANILTFLFGLLGIALLQWYIFFRLLQVFQAQAAGSEALRMEIARRRQAEQIQKQAESATQESEEKFRAIIESLPLGVHMYRLQEDNALVLYGYNPAANRILKVDHAQYLGKTIEEAFPGLKNTPIPARYREVARTGKGWQENQVDYSTHPIQGAYEVYAFQTVPGMMVAVFADITQRINDAEGLRLSEEKFSKAFHTSPDSVNINRLSDGVYIDINEGFTQLMGYEREEALGKSSLELNIWVDPADRAKLVKGLLEAGVVDHLEARFRRKNGSIGIGLMSARIIMVNGVKCILSITHEETARILAERELRETHMKLIEAYEATLQGWAYALGLRERETANHSKRVVEYTMQMASALGIQGEDLVFLRRGALLHDIGKMGVPDQILLKPGQLTPEEWVIMRKHTEYARDMLITVEYLRHSIDIPYYHHEKWDGSGYPEGRKGKEIPLGARIFAVADVYDALTSDRPYRPAWSRQQARDYLIEQSGVHFDPEIVALFLRLEVL